MTIHQVIAVLLAGAFGTIFGYSTGLVYQWGQSCHKCDAREAQEKCQGEGCACGA